VREHGQATGRRTDPTQATLPGNVPEELGATRLLLDGLADAHRWYSTEQAERVARP
jgi:hypothetical protein